MLGEGWWWAAGAGAAAAAKTAGLFYLEDAAARCCWRRGPCCWSGVPPHFSCSCSLWLSPLPPPPLSFIHVKLTGFPFHLRYAGLPYHSSRLRFLRVYMCHVWSSQSSILFWTISCFSGLLLTIIFRVLACCVMFFVISAFGSHPVQQNL
jgi:hypothetical protein